MSKKWTDQFVMRWRKMIESPAHRVLSLNGRRFLDRLEIEHHKHGGRDVPLPCTAQDFTSFGIDKDAVAPAERENIALGFVKKLVQGFAGKGRRRRASAFGLTYVGDNPTNDWQHILTVEDAKRIAKAARSNKATNKVGFGWISDPDKPPNPIRENRVRPDPENPDQYRSGKTGVKTPNPDPENPDVYLDICP
jgi:hypothetical protein